MVYQMGGVKTTEKREPIIEYGTFFFLLIWSIYKL